MKLLISFTTIIIPRKNNDDNMEKEIWDFGDTFSTSES